MDNTINNCIDLSFGSRYLKVKKGNKMPLSVFNAVQNNDAIRSYLEEGRPNKLFGKIVDFFTRREFLEISLVRGVYAEYDRLNFSVRKAFGKIIKTGYVDVDPNKVAHHPNYQSIGPRWQNKDTNLNFDIADENMVEQISKIKSMDDIFAPKVNYVD